GVNEAVTWGEATLAGNPLVIVCLDFAFMGGSMGAATGEKITNGIERALHSRLPLLIISASGGARMQEGMLSLMQMAKPAAALGRLGAAPRTARGPPPADGPLRHERGAERGERLRAAGQGRRIGAHAGRSRVTDNGSIAAATWEQVELARHPDRPYALDYIHAIFGNFFELHGDRL